MEKAALGVKGLIKRNDMFLVLVKPNGESDLPGGRVEDGEGLEDSLHREILEETALEVVILGSLSTWEFVKNTGMQVRGVTYNCRYVGGNVILSHEHSDYFWTNQDMVTQYLD
jgi:8-oxo-dGTP diphosphatase